MPTRQLWRCSFTLNTASTIYTPCQGTGGVTTDSTLWAPPCAAAGNVAAMYIWISAAPGASKSYRFRLYKNGSASSNIDKTLTGTGSGDGITTGNVQVAEAVSLADAVQLQVTPSGTPAAATAEVWIIWEPTTDNEFVYFGGVNFNAANTGQVYTHINGQNSDSGTSDLEYRRTVMPFGGTVTRQYAAMQTAPGAGKTRTFCMIKNGSDDAGTFQVVDANKTNGNTGLSIALVAGDRIGFRQSTTSGTPSTTFGLAFSCCIVPTVRGDFLIGHVSNGGGSNSAARYGRISSSVGAEVWNATESAVQITAYGTMFAKSLAIHMQSAPGVGKSNTFSLRQAAGDVGTALVFNDGTVVTKTSTFASAVTIALDDLIDVSCTPAGTPAVPGRMSMSVGFNFSSAADGGASNHNPLLLLGVG